MSTMLQVEAVSKTFTLHHQGGAELPVLSGARFAVDKGEAVVLSGPSGSGKSTLLRILFGNYRPSGGRVFVRHGDCFVDIVAATPRTVLEVRRRTLGWVSQFLRAIPRVSAMNLVAEPMLARGIERAVAQRRAQEMLDRLNLPARLWNLAPQTFSGGEQQRVNIARSFVDPAPIMVLDEPTASLDPANRDVVVELMDEARAAGISSASGQTVYMLEEEFLP
jgi:alpha-D-ribose 1-methylphosphonate 5-triphosphate synthase subunit PhnL